MSRNAVIRVIIAAAVVGGLGITGYYRYQQTHYVLTDDATVSGHQVVVSAETLGKIAELTASEGQTVAKGELLVRLDDATLAGAAKEAEAGVEAAKQAVSLAGVRLSQAQDNLKRATAELAHGIIPKSQYDGTKSAAEAARVAYAIAQAQARIAAARLQTVRTDLALTRVASPVDGVVAKRWRATGDVVAPTQPIYTLYDLHDLWVVAYVKETDIRFVRIGDPVRITVDSLPGRVFSGRVESVGAGTVAALSSMGAGGGSATFTKETQRLPVRIALDPMRTVRRDPGPHAADAEAGAGGGLAATGARAGAGGSAPDAGSDHPLLPGMSTEVRILRRQ